MAFEGIRDLVVEDLSILITGLSENPPSVEEKRWAEWIHTALQDSYQFLIASNASRLVDDRITYSRLYEKKLILEYRSELDLSTDGLLLDGKLPFIHIHFGHGDLENGELILSKGESEKGDFFRIEEYVEHINQHYGFMWMAVFPTCFGSKIAKFVFEKSSVFSAWGSLEEKPVATKDALLDLPHEINNEVRRMRSS